MLSFLRIRGLALLDDVSLELAPGMNVLTGETGAGKSIIVDALALLRGARGRAELVRDGADALVVDAQFDLAGAAGEGASEILAAHGLDPLGEEGLVVRRRIPRAGRGRSIPRPRRRGRGHRADGRQEARRTPPRSGGSAGEAMLRGSRVWREA